MDTLEELRARLADAERRVEVQYVVSRALSHAETVQDAVQTLLPSLADALGWAYAALWVVEPPHLKCVQAWSIPEPAVRAFCAASERTVFEAGRGLPGRCWAAGEAVWLAAVQRDPTLSRVALARTANLFGGLAFPVMGHDGVVGVVEGFTKERETVSQEFLRLTEAIGRQIGQFLHRQAAEQQVRRNESRYRAIINGALDAIVVIGPDGRTTEFNAAAERLFGYSRAEAVGQDMASLIIPEAFQAAHRAGLKRLREHGEARVLERRLELTARRRDGSEFPVELSISRFADGRSDSFIGFLRDITERQRHGRERDALLAREQVALREASAASRLKDEFLAALSHELRTPLNAVAGWAQMLEQGALPPEKQRQAIAVIRRNAEAQQHLVDDMLDLSAFISGRVRLALEPVDLAEPLTAAIEAVRPAAAARRLAIDAAMPAVRVMGDRVRLQQVFWNLLGNAVKFTPPGGRVAVAAATREEAVVLEICDTGVGIAPQFLPFVFDRFRQGASPGTGGLGLGLAIVRQIVEAHGGQVAAFSDGPGTGSRFVVTLPRA